MIDKLLTEKNRNKFPSQNFKDWTPLESAAKLIKLWSFGENRPQNGFFLGFDVEKKGKVIFPRYY